MKVFKVRDVNKEATQILILIGFKGNTDIDDSKYEEYRDLLNMEIVDFSSDKGISTDDYAPIGN